MECKPPGPNFMKDVGRIINARMSRALVLSGNIHDLFRLDGDAISYVPLIDFMTEQWKGVSDRIQIVYKLNGPIRFVNEVDKENLKDAYQRFLYGAQAPEKNVFEADINLAQGNPGYALEFLRQLCMCSRNARSCLQKHLLIIIERADMLMPAGDMSHLSDSDRHRIHVCHDWFSDQGFSNGNDCVIMIAESRSMVNREIASLPQILEAETLAPSREDRRQFIDWFSATQNDGKALWRDHDELSKFTAGLSIHALQQLLRVAKYQGTELRIGDITKKVEEYIKAQIGQDVVEFVQPDATMDKVVGFSRLKTFLSREFIPRLRSSGSDTLTGAIVCGPIGSGKTFIFLAVAGELGMPVLTIKNIRSQWFGETDIIFERLRRVLFSLDKALIIVDEADTQFGGVGSDVHETERRLTGRLQAMISDPDLRGRIHWLLVTARIHLLSPDLKRPGRCGDLIIPILDPTEQDAQDFADWTLKSVVEKPDQISNELRDCMKGYSASSFASLRAELIFRSHGGNLSPEQIKAVLDDHLPPISGRVRRYQELQALVHCTHRSLLDRKVTEDIRKKWLSEILMLEMEGIK